MRRAYHYEEDVPGQERQLKAAERLLGVGGWCAALCSVPLQEDNLLPRQDPWGWRNGNGLVLPVALRGPRRGGGTSEKTDSDARMIRFPGGVT